MTVKWYGHNTRQFIRVKPEMSGCKLWPVGGTGGHCFVYKDGRYDHNNCMAHYEQVLRTEALDLLDLTLATTVPHLKFYTRDDLLSIVC
jgi:hypothetical protein